MVSRDLPEPGSTGDSLIEGPVGALEVRVSVPRETPTALAIICHPHPLYGGTMDNKVVYSLSRCLERSGHLTVRFNFRGVGRSEGGYADGDGEQDDAIAVVDWIRESCPESLPLSLAGFSFGGYVAWQVASRVGCRQLVTIAPAVRFFTSAAPRPDCRWLVVQGDDDDIVDPGDVRRLIGSLSPQPDFRELSATGHFFHGRLGDLRREVDDFLGGAGE